MGRWTASGRRVETVLPPLNSHPTFHLELPTSHSTISALTRLLSLPRFADHGAAAYRPGLGRMRALLEAMGRPDQAFPIIHVGGTNGKGSTASFAAAILTAAGRRVGLHTSPHLLELGERMRVGGRPAPAAWLEAAAARHDALFERVGASFFEATAALALEHFAEAGVDLAVLEVGLGGRFDATNVVSPAASAVTNVGLDHTEILGDTVAAIAREKAGIVKAGVPLFTTATGEALAVVRDVALAAGAPFEDVRESVELDRSNGHWRLLTPAHTFERLEIGLPGEHQAWNAALAVRLVETVAPDHAPAAVHAGLRDVAALSGLRGRGDALPGDPRVVLDVAHNADGWRAALAALHVPPGGRLHALVGVMEDKDAAALASTLAGAGAATFVANLPSPRALSADALAAAMEEAGVEVAAARGGVGDGLAWFSRRAGEADRLIVTGSHITVAEALLAGSVGEYMRPDARDKNHPRGRE